MDSYKVTFCASIILESRKHRFTKVDILGFEFEMGLFPNVLEEAKSKGIELSPKYIPRDVFDKRAVEKNQVSFHDVAYIAAKPLFKNDRSAKTPQLPWRLNLLLHFSPARYK
jgi:hypothetical protein